MATVRSEFPASVTRGYWEAVRQALQKQHSLSQTAAQCAVSRFKAALAEYGVGDIIYHESIDATAQGIITGEYAVERRTVGKERRDGMKIAAK